MIRVRQYRETIMLRVSKVWWDNGDVEYEVHEADPPGRFGGNHPSIDVLMRTAAHACSSHFSGVAPTRTEGGE